MLKDAKGNDFIVGKWYEDCDEKFKVVEITQSGKVIVDWFGEDMIVSNQMADDMYPEGEYPESKKFGGWDWYRILEEEYMQKPRDLFQIYYEQGVWFFAHKWRNIDPEGELPLSQAYSTQKELFSSEFNELEDQIKDYLMSIT